mgnify:CR=1 FL=1
MQKYVLFDRDGTLIKHVHHLHKISQIEWTPNIFKALKKIAEKDYLLGIITNQSIIGRGISTIDEVRKVNDFIAHSFNIKSKVKFEFIKVCPHIPNENCRCRKPEIGLLESEMQSGTINFPESYFVGDSESDVNFAQRLGLKSILYRSEYSEDLENLKPDYIISNMLYLDDIIT